MDSITQPFDSKSLILDLPKEVIIHIFSRWLSVVNLHRLDTALLDFPGYHHALCLYLKHRRFVLAYDLHGIISEFSLLEWVWKRGVAVEALCLHPLRENLEPIYKYLDIKGESIKYLNVNGEGLNTQKIIYNCPNLEACIHLNVRCCTSSIIAQFHQHCVHLKCLHFGMTTSNKRDNGSNASIMGSSISHNDDNTNTSCTTCNRCYYLSLQQGFESIPPVHKSGTSRSLAITAAASYTSLTPVIRAVTTSTLIRPPVTSALNYIRPAGISGLNSISLVGVMDPGPALRVIARHCPQLQRIQMVCCRNIAAGYSNSEHLLEVAAAQRDSSGGSLCVEDNVFTYLAEGCPLLQQVNIQVQSVEDVSGVTDNAIATIAKECQKLSFLRLSFMEKITQFGVLEILRKCTLLHTLLLNHCHTLEPGALTSIANYGHQLHVLDLSHCIIAVTDEGILNIVEKCLLLRELGVYNCPQLSAAVLYRLRERHLIDTDAAMSGYS